LDYDAAVMPKEPKEPEEAGADEAALTVDEQAPSEAVPAPSEAVPAPDSESDATPEAESATATATDGETSPEADSTTSSGDSSPDEKDVDNQNPTDTELEPSRPGAPDGEPAADLGAPRAATADAEARKASGGAKPGGLTRTQKARRGVLLLLLLLAVTFLVMKYLVGFEGGSGVQASNTCAIGPDAPASGAIDVALAEPASLDGLTRQELLALRAEAVTRHPRLLVGDYLASDEVFGDLDDGLSWWGIDGERIHGAGPMADDGVSRDSVLLLNPFILVGLEVPLAPWGDYDITRESFVEETMAILDGALGPKPVRVTWKPQERRAEVAYDMRSFRKSFDKVRAMLVQEAKKVLPKFSTQVTFRVYNARDLGFNYMRIAVSECGLGAEGVDKTEAEGLPPAPWPFLIEELAEGAAPKGLGDGGGEGEASEEDAEPSGEPVIPELPIFELRERLGESDACGIPDASCNDVLQLHKELTEGLQILALPVRVTFHLWRDEPDGDVVPPPDMKFVVAME